MGPLLGDGEHLVEEPRVDPGGLVHRVDRQAPRRSKASSWNGRSGVAMPAEASEGVVVELVERGHFAGVGVEPLTALLEGTQRLLERLGERPADRHHLTHRLHRRAEHPAGARELLERPPGDLGDHVVDRGLEARRRLLR